MTKAKTSHTQRLANAMARVGYHIQSVTEETKELTGRIVLYDNNPEDDPKKSRKRLSVIVNPEKKYLSLTVHAERYTTKRRQTADYRAYVGTNEADFDVELRNFISRSAKDIGIDKSENVLFDPEWTYLTEAVQLAEDALEEAWNALLQYEAKADAAPKGLSHGLVELK
jgi:hypothetical protein